MCEKRRFPSAHAVRKANASNGKRIRCYWCQECRAWHATSQKNTYPHLSRGSETG